MAVIDLRRPAGEMMQVGAGLAGGLMELFRSDEDEARELLRRAMLENFPATARAVRSNAQDLPAGIIGSPGTQMGQAQTQALQGVSDFSELGLDPAFLQMVSEAFPSSFEEELDRELVAEGAPEARAEQVVQEAQAGALTAENIAELQENLGALGYGEAEANARVTEALSRNANAEFQNRFYTSMLEKGTPEAQALLQDFETQNGIIKSENQLDALTRFSDYYDLMNEEDKRWVSLTMQSPALANLFLQLERMSMEDLIRGAKTNGLSAPESFELKNKFREAFTELEERLRAFDEEGAREGQMQALLARYNQLARDYIQMFPTDPVTMMDPIDKLFGDPEVDDVLFKTLEGRGLLQRSMLGQLLANNWTVDQLRSSELGSEMWGEEWPDVVDQIITEYEILTERAQSDDPVREGANTIEDVQEVPEDIQQMSTEELQAELRRIRAEGIERSGVNVERNVQGSAPMRGGGQAVTGPVTGLSVSISSGQQRAAQIRRELARRMWRRGQEENQ